MFDFLKKEKIEPGKFESYDINKIKGKRKINLIDVRTPMEFNAGHIKGAKNIPKSKIQKYAKENFSKDETYYIMCKGGSRSLQASKSLSKNGFNVVNLEGGYDKCNFSKISQI